ncbi:MAG: N-acetylneuraminate synthase family protein [Treponema sp.]|nr:N-acetylneuraminate synthase family protein [Treponema sp.]
MALEKIKLSDTRSIGKGEPVFFIGEIGINHNGEIDIIKKLIDSAFACSWDCVKFQKRVPELAVPEKQKSVMRQTPWGEMTYLEYKKHVELNKEQYDFIDSYCKEKPLMWSCSPWDMPSLKFILEYDIPFIKIASATITQNDILIEAAKSGKPIIMSTGMSTLEEVDEAVNVLEKYTSGNYVLMHTNSAYPSPLDELNLSTIQFLKDRYKCIVGYSGHEYEIEPSAIAATLGAKVIERHITVNHEMWGTDQMCSLEMRGMDLLYRRVKMMERVLGTPMVAVTEHEKAPREKLRGN